MKTENEKIEETLERERLRTPQLSSRLIAYIADDLLISIVVIIIASTSFIDIQTTSEGLVDGNALMAAILTVVPLNLVLIFTYHWLFIAVFGSTLGKMLCKIRVVDITMLDNPSYKQAAIRSVVRLLSAIFYYLPFIAIFADDFKRAFHDKLAKTIALSLD